MTKQKQTPAIIALSKRTKENCMQGIQRRVNITVQSIAVLEQQGVEYRPSIYTEQDVEKMFAHLQAKLDKAKQVFKSGLKPIAMKKDFTFDSYD